jgi:hypothetical protein
MTIKSIDSASSLSTVHIVYGQYMQAIAAVRQGRAAGSDTNQLSDDFVKSLFDQ